MRAFSIVEESSDLDAACEPPRGTAGQSFPVAVRKEVSSSPSSSSSSSVSFAGAIGDADAEADAARMFAAMSEKDILKAQEEITQLASSKTVDILKKRAARFANSNNSNTNINNINRASNSHVSVAPVVNAVSAPSGVVVKDAEVRELVLPPIEHEKLAWTDPETKQQPREKEEFAHSLRVQSFRFGLEGEIVPEDAANEHTYNSGLHHHGEDPDKPGYTLDELSTLMRSQNEPQNLFAAKLLLCLVQRIVTGDYTKELLYPESGARSMTVGEGILWEFLGMKMLVPLRICCFKRSPALRSTCVALVEALCVALADDEELGKQAHQPHWGNLVFPSAPLFEDDGSEEMEKLDGLRCMVRQLDFLPLFDPGTVMGLTCLAKIAGHSRTLALMISSHSELLDAIVTSGMLVAPAKALRLLRLLLSSDSRHVRSMEQKGVPASCWRFLLSPLDADTQQEALLLLRVMLLFGSQVSDLIHVLPDLVTRVLDGRMSPWRPCFLCDALVVAAPDIDHVVIESLLRACVSHCLTEMDAVAVIHLAASAARRWSGINIRSKISPLLIRLQNGSQSFWLATMRLANASSDVLAELPTWVWNTDCIVQAAASLCRPLAQADKVNRFQTQRRLRELVAHREGILLVREMLIAGVHSMGQADAVALFGLAFDMVSRLAIIGADEWLLFDLLERVLLNPLFLERVTCQLVPDESHNTAESLHQCKMLCSSLLEGVQGTFFADKDWLKRCRSVVGEGDANDVRPDGFFAGESLCMGSFVGADWLFRLCKSESGDTVRSAMQMLLLAELTKSTKSLSIMSNTSKLIKVEKRKARKFLNFFFLKKKKKSFVVCLEVPIVHFCTLQLLLLCANSLFCIPSQLMEMLLVVAWMLMICSIPCRQQRIWWKISCQVGTILQCFLNLSFSLCVPIFRMIFACWYGILSIWPGDCSRLMQMPCKGYCTCIWILQSPTQK